MQLLWFLPSIAYGAMLAVSSGSYFLLVSTLLTAILMLLVKWRTSLQPKLGPETKLRFLGNNIWLDDFRLPRGSAFWSREQFDFVFERLAVKRDSVKALSETFAERRFDSLRPMSTAIGFDDNEIISVSLNSDGPHGILVGTTGSGKTELLKTLVRGISESTRDAEFALVDFKGGSGLAQFAAAGARLITDQDLSAANQLFEDLKIELKQRESKQQLSPIIVVVDELAHLLNEVKIAESVLNSIAARGRSARMHLIVTNQNLVGIPRALLSNLRLRILVGLHDPVDAALLGQPAKAQAAPEVGFRLTQAQLVGHGQPGRLFWFTGFRPERLPISAPEAREPRLLQHSSLDRHERSAQGRASHRHGRRRASRGWPALARKAESR